MDRPHQDPLGDVAAFAVLADERRRDLYDHVAGAGRPVSRDEAAEATGIGRPLAAYHLDRLAEAGLLDVEFARPPGRSGPGAGRPAKRYVRPARALAAQTPARDYPFVAQLLAEIVEATADPDRSGTAHALARERGRAAGATVTSPDGLEALLAARGYEPRREPDGTLRLANCPFHAVATTHPELVCGLNHAYIEGLLERVGDTHTARLDPHPGRCCVTIGKRAA